MDTLEEQANTLSRCGSFYYRILTDASKEEAEYMSHLTFCNRTNAQLRQISNAVLGGCYYKDFYRTFRFTDADVDWNGVEDALQRRDTTDSNPVPARYEQLTIEGAFLGQTDETHVAADSDAKAILFPDADSSVTLPATQELTWDLRIDPNIMVTSIEQPNGDILYANIDFGSTFGKLTFLVNPIKLFPNMQLFARSYTGRMPNLYNYMLRLDDVYGPVDRVLYHYRHAQTPKSLYYASAQACGLAVVRQDCTIASVAPLLDGYAYSTTDGVYDAPYPHSKLAEGAELKKDTVIGGDELYVLCGPRDQLPPSVTSISLDNILPVKGLSAPNADIAVYNSAGLYQPEYDGPAKKLEQYWTFQQSQKKIWSPDLVKTFTATASNRDDFFAALTVTSVAETGYQEGDSYKLAMKVTGILGGDTRIALRLGSVVDLYTQATMYYGFGLAPTLPNSWLDKDETSSSYEWTINCENGFPSANYSWGSYTEPAYSIRGWRSVDGVFVTIGIEYDAAANATIVEIIGGPDADQITTNRLILENLHVPLTDLGYNTANDYNGISAGTINLEVPVAATPMMDFPEENAIDHIRTVVCPNRVITACINEGYMTRDMYLKLTNFLQRELLVGSVLATANLPVSIQEDAGSIELLPSGYTQLEYLESDGSQVIQTGLLARSYNTRFKIRFNDLRTSDTPRMVAFGFWSNKSRECCYVCADDESGYLQIQMNQYGRVRKIDRNYTLDCKKSKGSIPKVVYNGQEVAYLNYNSELALTNDYQNPISLFGFTVSDKATPAFIGQLFYFELYVDDVKIGHLIPCLDGTGTPCMYDIVRHTPYYNDGSGDFTYPSLESSTTYSLRRPVAEYAKLTPHGVRRLYKLPDNYTGDPEQYIAENGFKRLVEAEKPEEGYWTPVWHDREDRIELEWVETEPPIEEEFTAQEEQPAPVEQ